MPSSATQIQPPPSDSMLHPLRRPRTEFRVVRADSWHPHSVRVMPAERGVATMVDSTKGLMMATDLEGMPERVDRVEQKVDGLTASVDERFDAVDQAFLEQRQYTEFAFDQLRAEMRAGFGQVDARFGQVDARFGQVDARFDRMDTRFDRMATRFDRMDARFDTMDTRFDRMDARFDTMDARFSRLERKFDQVIDRLDRNTP